MRRFTLVREQNFDTDEHRKICHNRLYHDGYGWNNRWFEGGEPVTDPKTIGDMDAMRDFMRAKLKNGLPDIRKIVARYQLQSVGDGEYNLFSETPRLYIWIRLINRRGDYNMYLHFYEKEMCGREQGEHLSYVKN